ncbi:MAG: EamA family transporter [Clostridia bacterium]|nr:EamA family transporter [Clostridia bacterium]
MWTFFCLFTVAAWALTEFFGKVGSKQNEEDKLSHWKITACVGFAMGALALVYIIFLGTDVSIANIISYAPISLCYIVSMIFGYVGLRYIMLSISSPVSNASCGVTSILCVIFLNQVLNPIQVVAVVAIVLGIIILGYTFVDREAQKSSDKKYTRSLIALSFPVLYCILDGIGSYMDALYLNDCIMTENEVTVCYFLTFFVVGLLAWIYVGIKEKKMYNIFSNKWFCFQSLGEAAGQITYVFALSEAPAIAAPLIASYGVVSILLSRIFLKEKLTKFQYVIIAVVMASMFVLSFE